MRVLYVAMTRAQDRLIMTYTDKKIDENDREKIVSLLNQNIDKFISNLNIKVNINFINIY